MDFSAELVKSLKKCPGLDGLIFVDPDGEAILFEGSIDDPFHLQLAGAKMPILMGQYQSLDGYPAYMELQFETEYVISIRLIEDYSITAIGSDVGKKGQIKSHLEELAVKFNREIA